MFFMLYTTSYPHWTDQADHVQSHHNLLHLHVWIWNNQSQIHAPRPWIHVPSKNYFISYSLLSLCFSLIPIVWEYPVIAFFIFLTIFYSVLSNFFFLFSFFVDSVFFITLLSCSCFFVSDSSSLYFFFFFMFVLLLNPFSLLLYHSL